MLAYSFSPRVQSIPRGPRIFARNDKVLRTEWKPLQKRLKCLCGIQNKPNKHYTVLKLIILSIHYLTPDTGQFLLKKMVIYLARVSF